MPSSYVFERYQTHDGEWRWSLNAPDGKAVAAAAKGYKTRESCDRAIAKIKKEAPSAEKAKS